MMKFTDWLAVRESSAFTRERDEAAKGLKPPIADIYSRSTPPPAQADALEKKLKASHKKKKKKKHGC